MPRSCCQLGPPQLPWELAGCGSSSSGSTLWWRCPSSASPAPPHPCLPCPCFLSPCVRASPPRRAAGIRDHFVQSVELKFNCFFLMPIIDTFPTRLREELESAYDEDLDEVRAELAVALSWRQGACQRAGRGDGQSAGAGVGSRVTGSAAQPCTSPQICRHQSHHEHASHPAAPARRCSTWLPCAPRWSCG